MLTSTFEKLLTEQEYLELEEKAQVRHKFINGRLHEMPGETLPHEQVVANIQFVLKASGLRLFSHGLRVRNPETKNYYYPDVVVTEEKVSKATYIESPLLIAGILSPSTQANALAEKFLAYRRFSTLKYYLLAEADFY